MPLHALFAFAEPYGYSEGGSDDDWCLSYEALRDMLIRKRERACLFTRRYSDNFTLDIAVLSEDEKSIVQVLLGAAIVDDSSGAQRVYPLPSALAKQICAALGVKPSDLAVRGKEEPEKPIFFSDPRLRFRLRPKQPVCDAAFFALLARSRKAAAAYAEKLRRAMQTGDGLKAAHLARVLSVTGARHFESSRYSLLWAEAMAGFMPAFCDVYAAASYPQLAPPPPPQLEDVALPADFTLAHLSPRRDAVLDPRNTPREG